MQEFSAISDDEFARRSARAWRIALACYLVPVSVATHWPRLGFGGGGEIDKFIHFLAFGVLCWICMNARPWGRPLFGFAFAAAWVYIDERTQAIEILGRTFSGFDMIAGWIGVAMAGLLFAARRAGTPAGTDARADADLADAIAYAHAPTWARCALVTLGGVLVVGSAEVLGDHWSEPGITLGSLVYGTGLGGFVGAALAAYGAGLFGLACLPRARGRQPKRIPNAALPRWWPFAVVAASGALFVAYLAFIELCFGAQPSEELRTDHGGFVRLQTGFLLAALLVGLVSGKALAVQAAFRANPAIAARR
jgi:hypothetical protein